MAQFYTRTQIDQIATVIGTEVKGLKSGMVPAGDSSSFVSALDSAIGSGPGTGGSPVTLAPNNLVRVKSRSGNANTNFSFTVNGGAVHNSQYDRIQDYWQIYRSDAPMPDYSLGISLDEGGVLFTSNNFEEDLIVELMFNPNYPEASDFELFEGLGIISSDPVTGTQIITFKLARAEFSDV